MVIDIKTGKEVEKAVRPRDEDFEVSANEMASTVILENLAPRLLKLANALVFKEEIADVDELGRCLVGLEFYINQIAENEGLDI